MITRYKIFQAEFEYMNEYSSNFTYTNIRHLEISRRNFAKNLASVSSKFLTR
jgi:hypothetical protein